MQDRVVSSNILYPQTTMIGNAVKVLDTHKNLEWLIAHYNIEVKYNIMKKQREVIIPNVKLSSDNPQNDALRHIEYLATINHMPIKRIDSHLDHIASQNEYHPIVKSILDKPWDGNKRLDKFASSIKTNNQKFSNEIIMAWMRSAITAAFSKEGFLNQGVLVIQGDQGIGKSSWVKSLDPINCNAIKESAFLDPTNKDSIIQLASYWISELAELECILKKSDIGRLKAFVTSESDFIRLPYAKKADNIPRRSAYIATVNDENFLADDTGNRRWWVVKAQSIDLSHRLDMQQIWAESYEQIKNGMYPYLTVEQQKQLNLLNKNHERIDPLKEKLLTYYDWTTFPDKKMTATEVLNELGYRTPTKSDATRMGQLLKELNGKDPIVIKKQKVHDIPRKIYTSNFY